MREIARIAVGMSGGVDSSVAAALLKQEGHDVFGIMLRLWSPSSEIQNRCCSPADLALAQQVASKLDIPLYTLDVKERFKAEVVDRFINGYAQGITPNPCHYCNQTIRWGFLLDRALAMGASHIATGHYARIQEGPTGIHLLRAKDTSKDQSYILSSLTQELLDHTLFPLGDLSKDEVRQVAAQLELPVAERAESQDLCFLGGFDYREFLASQDIPLPPPGKIVDTRSSELGTHSGLAAYTIGQRKGIGIAAREPYYVIDKNLEQNELIVGTRDQLGKHSFEVTDVNWISGNPLQVSIEALTRIRYKTREVRSTLEPLMDNRVRVKLKQSLPDITPGQIAVFYDQEVCLGGGIILR